MGKRGRKPERFPKNADHLAMEHGYWAIMYFGGALPKGYWPAAFTNMDAIWDDKRRYVTHHVYRRSEIRYVNGVPHLFYTTLLASTAVTQVVNLAEQAALPDTLVSGMVVDGEGKGRWSHHADGRIARAFSLSNRFP